MRRNLTRFPADFMFQLTDAEFELLMSQFATSNPGRGGRRKRPLVFTEHGALMAATVLNSARAVEVSLYVVRALVRLRETLAAHKDLASKLHVLEKKTEALALRHDGFAASTRLQLRQVFEAIRKLMRAPEPAPADRLRQSRREETRLGQCFRVERAHRRRRRPKRRTRAPQQGDFACLEFMHAN